MIHETPTNGLSNGVSNGIAVGEIGLIRNILMGQYMQEYDDRFRLIEQKVGFTESDIAARLANLHKENNAQIESLEKAYNEKLRNLEKNCEEKIAALEKVLLHNIAETNLKMVDLSRSDRADIGQVLIDMGKKLMKA
jgi:hypothetical protein